MSQRGGQPGHQDGDDATPDQQCRLAPFRPVELVVQEPDQATYQHDRVRHQAKEPAHVTHDRIDQQRQEQQDERLRGGEFWRGHGTDSDVAAGAASITEKGRNSNRQTLF